MRYHELDSLRGLAAITVVVDHLVLTFGPRSLHGSPRPITPMAFKVWEASPLHLISAGREAVVLFFLLSGYVLALPFFAGKPPNYPTFLVRRFCRLYLPYLVALLFSCSANWFFYGPLPAASDWAQMTWQARPDLHTILQQATMVGHFSFPRFNTAFWSLVYEARISCLFPLLILLVGRIPGKATIALAVLSSLFAQIVFARFATPDLCDNFHFGSLFLLGIAAAKYRTVIKNYIECHGQRVLSIALWTAIAVIALNRVLKHILFLDRTRYLSDWPAIAATAMLLLCALYDRPFQHLLRHKVPLYLGKISYSLYLTHATILFLFLHLFLNRVPLLVWAPGYIALALAVASVFYLAIEQPATALSRRIRFEPAAAEEAPPAPELGPAQSGPDG